MFMNMNIGFDLSTSARAGLSGLGVEMLVHAVVVHDRHVARLPVVADAVVDLVALAVQDVERRLVDVAVLLVRAARRVLLEVDVQRLRHAVDRLDEMLGERLRAVLELHLLAADDARQRAQARELVLQAVLALDRADEAAASCCCSAIPCPFIVSQSLALSQSLSSLSVDALGTAWPLRNSSDQIFSHFSISSSTITGSIMWNGNLFRCGLDRGARGHAVALLEHGLPLGRKHEIGEQQRGVRTRRALGHGRRRSAGRRSASAPST